MRRSSDIINAPAYVRRQNKSLPLRSTSGATTLHSRSAAEDGASPDLRDGVSFTDASQEDSKASKWVWEQSCLMKKVQSHQRA